MRILEWKVPADYELILFGDNQEGNALQHKAGFLSCLDYIASDKNRFGLHMGDLLEGYWVDDPRYNPYVLTKTPLQQLTQAQGELAPLAKKKRLISVLLGNHEWRLTAKAGNVTAFLCKNLGIQYAGYSCVIKFVDKHGLQFRGHFRHGKKPIRSTADDPIRRAANEKLQLKQHLKHKFGDCLLMAKGHCHRLIIAEPESQLYLTTPEDTIEQNYTRPGGDGWIHPDHRWYCCTGSFLKTMDENKDREPEEDIISYSELGEYDPVALGYAIVTVHDRQITGIKPVYV